MECRPLLVGGEGLSLKKKRLLELNKMKEWLCEEISERELFNSYMVWYGCEHCPPIV